MRSDPEYLFWERLPELEVSSALIDQTKGKLLESGSYVVEIYYIKDFSFLKRSRQGTIEIRYIENLGFTIINEKSISAIRGSDVNGFNQELWYSKTRMVSNAITRRNVYVPNTYIFNLVCDLLIKKDKRILILILNIDLCDCLVVTRFIKPVVESYLMKY